MNIRILLSVKYNIYRKCLKNTLERYNNLCVAGETDFLEDVDNILPERSCDVILTDMNMKNDIFAEDIINKITFENEIGVIALIPSDDISMLKGLSLEKFNGVVSLSAEFDKLVNSIHIAANKGKYIDECFLYKLEKGKDEKTNQLTNREIEVLKLIAKGCFNKEIASKMGISERTVKNHVSNIFKKIDVCDRTQAALYAIRNNIIIL